MAHLIKDQLYRVALDSERSFEYVSARDKKDLMAFLVDEFAGKRDVFSVKAVGRDGSLSTVTVITDPEYQKMVQDRLDAMKTSKQPLSEQIRHADARKDNPTLPGREHGKER